MRVCSPVRSLRSLSARNPYRGQEKWTYKCLNICKHTQWVWLLWYVLIILRRFRFSVLSVVYILCVSNPVVLSMLQTCLNAVHRTWCLTRSSWASELSGTTQIINNVAYGYPLASGQRPWTICLTEVGRGESDSDTASTDTGPSSLPVSAAFVTKRYLFVTKETGDSYTFISSHSFSQNVPLCPP